MLVPACVHTAPPPLRRSHSRALARASVPPPQLVPRLNPIPSSALTGFGTSRDRDRLLHRLALYGLCEREVRGDGNCQFRALSDQLYRSPDHHLAVRAKIVQRLRTAPERYMEYVVDMTYGDYVASMARPGTWGDHVTLQAAGAQAVRVRVAVSCAFAHAGPQGGGRRVGRAGLGGGALLCCVARSLLLPPLPCCPGGTIPACTSTL